METSLYFKENINKLPFTNTALFSRQNELQKLPLPDLEQTIKRFLKTLIPLCEEKEYKEMERLAFSFLNGQGKILQKRLLEKAEKDSKGWLLELWNNYAYLESREPIFFSSNYFGGFKDSIFLKLIEKDQNNAMITVASKLIEQTLAFYMDIKNNQISQETTNKGAPLCSHMYNYLFNTCRIPRKERDETIIYDPSNTPHIIVMFQNNFFQLNVTDSSGNPLETSFIKKSLRSIVNSENSEQAHPIGIFTTLDRNKWFNIREKLLENELNRQSLHKIESSLFVVCLDYDEVPKSLEEACRIYWHGNGKNRFFDKSFQFIVCRNGKAGINAEHSMMDGTITNRFFNHFLEKILAQSNEEEKPFQSSGTDQSTSIENKSILKTNESQTPLKLDFHVEEIKGGFQYAEDEFNRLKNLNQFEILEFNHFGKNFILEKNLGPDGFVQMALQLAYYNSKGTVVPTYESTQTRSFLYGRTETTRSCSEESLNWVKSMASEKVSDDKKLRLLKEALNAHKEYISAASKAQGVDRHLLGLKSQIKVDEPIPEFFKHPLFGASQTWKLSTSQIISNNYNAYGFGVVLEDFYGITYLIKDESLFFGISRIGKKGKFGKEIIEEALLKMKDLVERTNTKPKPHL